MKRAKAATRYAPDYGQLEERVMLSATPVTPFVLDGATTDPSVDSIVDIEQESLADQIVAVADASHARFEQDGHSRLQTIHGSRDFAQGMRLELVFVDRATENYEQLLHDLLEGSNEGREFQVYLLDDNRDGIEQISEILLGYSDVGAMHVVSHGAAGQLKLGSIWLNADNLQGYSGELARWNHALSDGADLLLYGCDFAADQGGQILAQALAELCRCDVLASNDDTGHDALGGDWTLEFATGHAETRTAFSTQVHHQWMGLLSAAPVGGVLNVNQTPNATVQSTVSASPNAIATDANGNFVVVWESTGQDGSGLGVYARRFASDGTPLGNEFRVNTTTIGDQYNPAIAMNDTGAFVVVYQTDKAAGAVRQDIYAVLYNASGAVVKAEFRVNSAHTTDDQLEASVTMRQDGSFIVAWTSANQDGDRQGVYGQRFDASGNAVGNLIALNNVTPLDQFNTSIDSNAHGDFIATWTSKTSVDNKFSIKARMFDSLGAARGSEFTVDQYEGTDQQKSDVAYADDGSFVIVWQSTNQDANSDGIYARRFDASGQPQGNEFRVHVSSATVDESAPSVDMNNDGNIVVTWTKGGAEIFSREFDALNNATTPGDIRVASLVGIQGASVRLAPSGDYVVVFSGSGPSDTGGVFAQRFRIPRLPTIDVNGTAPGTNLAASFVEGDAPSNVTDLAATLADSDSTQLKRVTVVITNLLDGANEILSADTNGTSLTALYSNGQLVIEGSGPTDLAQFLTVLRTVKYENTSQSPHTNDRLLRFLATDTSLFSGSSAYTTVSVQAVNDVPQIVAPSSITSNEDTPLTLNGVHSISLVDDSRNEKIDVTLSVTNGMIDLSSRLDDESRIHAVELLDQTVPSVAVASDGRYVVVWQTTGGLNGDDIFARTYNADGTPISSDLLVTNNAAKHQRNPDVAMFENGDFVVVWEHDSENVTAKWDVYVRSFDISGNPLGGNEKRVHATTADDQLAPTVGASTNGTFVVGWQSKTALNGKDIYFRAFDAELNTLVGETLVNAHLLNDQVAPDVAFDGNGQFAVVWQSRSQDGSGDGIYLRRFAANYSPLDVADVRVNATTANDQLDPAIAISQQGRMVVVWQSKGQDGPGAGHGVYAQRLDFATGSKIGGEIAVNTETENDQSAPTVAVTQDDKFVIVWQSYGQEADDESKGIFLQEFNADGTKLRGEVQVAQQTFRDQSAPSVAMTRESQYVAVWQSDNQDSTNDDGIYSQRFLRPGAIAFLTGDGVDDATTTVRGRVADLNLALQEMVFTPNANYVGTASLTIDVNDLGNSGQGGPEAALATVSLTLLPVNDAPSLTVPISTQQVPEAQPYVLNVANANAISVDDVDVGNGLLRIALSVTSGKLNVDLATGVSILAGANNSSSVTMMGSALQVNDALDGLIYTPNVGHLGADTLAVSASDLGNTGSGGPLVVTKTVAIHVFDFNIPPINVLPSSISMLESTSFAFTGANQIQLSDLDAAANSNMTVTLSVTHGLLKLTSAAGISVTGNWTAGDDVLVLTGGKSLVNTSMGSLSFTPDGIYAGSAHLLVTTSDLGNSGVDGVKTDQDVVAIQIHPNATNHSPTVFGSATATTTEETPVRFSSITSTPLIVNDDANNQVVRITLAASHGNVSLSSTAGGEFLVNSQTAKNQQRAATAMNQAGAFVVVWQSEDQDDSGEGIFAQRYDANGLPIGAEFRVNQVTQGDQTRPVIAMADDGSFAIVWTRNDQNELGIYGRRYDSSGVALGPEFRINTTQSRTQQNPSIAMDATGRFVVVWESSEQDGDDFGIYGQMYNDQGAKVGGEFRVNSNTAKDQRAASVAMDSDGDFVVVWQSKTPGDAKWDIRARRFDRDAVAKDVAEITINSVTDEEQMAPDVAMDGSGNFVVAWASRDLDYPDQKFGIFHRRFKADGTPETAQQSVVNTQIIDEQRAPFVAMDRNGDYVITWESRGQDKPNERDQYGVFGQRYLANGTKFGEEFRVNSTIAKDQRGSAIAIGGDGRFLIVWESNGQDGSGYGIYGQRFKDVEGLTFLQGDGDEDSIMVFEGSIDEINEALDGLVFTPAVDFDGITTLQLSVDDLGNSGGGSLTTNHVVSITVNGVNDAPTFVIPGLQTAYEEVPLVFSTANGNRITIADVDAGNNTVRTTLIGYGGKLTLNGTAGLTFTSGDGSNDTTLVFTGTISATNTALDGLKFMAPSGFAGEGSIQIVVDDLGNTGSGGSAVNSDVVHIHAEQDFANDVPSILVPGPQITAKNVALRFSNLDGRQVTINDDALDDPIRVQLSATNGTLTLTNLLGSQTQVNSRTADEQRDSKIATMPNGNHVVIWQSNNQDGSGEGIYGQRFNATGLKIGPEFRVNQFVSNDQTDPVVAMNSSGEFVVAWTSDGQDGDSLGVYVRKFDANGNAISAETLVNSSTLGSQRLPAVAIDAGGRFVVAWQATNNGEDIYFQRFDENGAAAGDETLANTTEIGNQTAPTIAMDAAGNFLIAWQSADISGQGIFAQRYDFDANRIGTTEFAVNTVGTAGDQKLPVAAMNSSGQFVIVWEGVDSNNAGIRMALFDTAGSLVKADSIVSVNQLGNQNLPAVAINDSGKFVVAWQSGAAGSQDVVGRVFDAAGNAISSDYAVNTVTANAQTAASAAFDSSGSAIMSWTSAGDQDGDKTGVYVQRILPDGAVTFHAGTGRNDAFVDIEGRPDFINGMLNGMLFNPTANFTGAAAIDIHVDDQGYTGTGGARTADDRIHIMVAGVTLDLDANDSSGADGANYFGHYTIGGPAARIFDTDRVIQTSASQLKSVTITLTNRPDGANESLTASTTGFPLISKSYNVASGVLTLSGQDSIANYQAVLETVRYTNSSATPNATERLITVQYRDRNNADSNMATSYLRFNKQPPTLALVGELNYTEGDPPSLLVQSATVADADNANFANGFLDVDMASSGSMDDQLAIRNEGSNVGQISVAALAISYNFGGATGNRQIGTLTTSGPYDGLGVMRIQLTADANPTSVAALIRNVTFQNVSADPETNLRAVRFVLDDGQGGVSQTASATIRVAATSGSAIGSISDLNGVADQVNENASNGTLVGITAVAVDPDVGSTTSYSLDVDSGGRFSIDANTGTVAVANASLIDYETAASHSVTVRATSSDGSFSTQVFTVTILPVNDNNPVFTSSDNVSMNENSSLIQTLAATDADLPSQTLSFSIAGGADAAKFSVNGAHQLVFISAPDFETPADADSDNTYEVDVLVHDGNGRSSMQSIRVSVQDQVEGNVITVDTTSDIVDGNVSDIVSLLNAKGADGRISLREAILAANNTANGATPDEIRFSIPDNDAGHLYYRDDGIAGSLSTVATTTAQDSLISDFDPDYPFAAHSWFRIDLNAAASELTVSDAVLINGYTQGGTALNTAAIGTNASLRIELTSSGADGDRGLLIQAGGSGSTIRGLAIHGFDFAGLLTDAGADGVVLQGNFFGTDITGSLDRGNGDAGIHLRSSGNLVGGNQLEDRNVVSGNESFGVVTFTLGPMSNGNQVINNLIGVDATGLRALANQTGGIQVWNQDGMEIRDNVISGNAGNGIWLRAGASQTNTLIVGNQLGVGSDGATAVGSSGAGIVIDGSATSTRIGGLGAGEANIIAHHGSDGITVTSGSGATIRGNQIFSNAGLGIDLGPDGVNPNDAGDADSGANNLQNFPVVSKAILLGADLLLTGTFNGQPSSHLVLDFYWSTSGDPTGFGEGSHFLGAIHISTDSGGNASFSNTFSNVSIPNGAKISATATSSNASFNTFSNTSEFSQIATAILNLPPRAMDDTYVVNEDVSLNIPASGVLGNDADVNGDVLTTILISTTIHGSLSFSSDGSFTYTPHANYFGNDSFTYRINDGFANSNLATVNITVTPQQDAPVAAVDAYSMDQSTSLHAAAPGVLANDSDIDGDALTAVLSSTTANGALTFNSDGSFDYLPDVNFVGTDNFVYRAFDGTNHSNPVNVSITVVRANIAPAPADDSYVVNEDTQLIVNASGVLQNDLDANADPLSATLVDRPSHGSLVWNVDGSFKYIPDANYSGVDTFTYRAEDGFDSSDVATVTITVDAINDSPLAGDDSFSVNEDSTIAIGGPGILGNDGDPDGDPISAVIAQNVSHGTLTLGADGSFQYTPAANYFGIDFFTYRATDGLGNSNLATVTINVASQNDAPTASDDSFTVQEDQSLSIPAPGLLANDSDIEASSLTAVLVQGPSHGTATVNSDGSFTFLPAANFAGIDSFTYRISDGISNSNVATVSITVVSQNDLPVASDDAYTLHEDASLSIAADGLLQNDLDADGDALVAQLVSSTNHGTLTFNSDGSFTFSPHANFRGNDRFIYRVTDGTGTSNDATVSLQVVSQNDAPLATNDAYTTNEDQLLSLPSPGLLVNDSDVDGDPLMVTLVAGPSHGAATLNADGSFTYLPDANFAGSDSITYRVFDGTVNSNVATVSIAVVPQNDLPVANGDSYSLAEDGVLSVAGNGVIQNDLDADGDSLVAQLVSSTSQGILLFNSAGSFTYTPNANFHGTDHFTYRVTDGAGSSNVATASILIQSRNDAPTANDDWFSLNEDESLLIGSGGLMTNDADSEGDSLSAILVEGPKHGSLAFRADGSFSFLPDAEFNGHDSFTYKVSDGSASSNLATVSITVNARNDAPVANDDALAIDQEETLAGLPADLLRNDYDIDRDALQAELVNTTNHGSLTFHADGSFTYTPDTGYVGNDTFVYRLTDGVTHSNLATVTITIRTINQAPTANPDSFSLDQQQKLEMQPSELVDNDHDPDGDPLTIIVVRSTSHGTLSTNSDGSLIYAPQRTFVGEDSFTYYVTDGRGNSNVVTVSLTVKAAGGPVASQPLPVPPPPSEDDPAEEAKSDPTPDREISIPKAVNDVPEFKAAPNRGEAPRSEPFNTKRHSPEPSRQSVETSQPMNVTGKAVEPRIRQASNVVLRDLKSSIANAFDSKLLWQDLADLSQEIASVSDLPFLTAGSAASVSTALTVGYVLWTIRSGWLATSLLAQMPAWRLVDPLLVLNYLDEPTRGGSDDEDDSLESMLERTEGDTQGVDESRENCKDKTRECSPPTEGCQEISSV